MGSSPETGALSHSNNDSVGVQNKPPQGVPQQYVDYFELKATETPWAQEKLLLPPFPVPLTI